MLVDHDVHVHTVLSSCAHEDEITPAAVLGRARRLGLRLVGFADHCWDPAVPGASDWYAPQTIDHVLRIREMLPPETGGVRVLVGCETEYCGAGKFGITPEGAARLDYVLVPASHFHMKGFTVPESLRDLDDVADLLVRRFGEVVESGLATGIPHPFMALGFEDRQAELIGRIGEARLADCFSRAAEAGVSMEIHTGMFPSLGGHGEALGRMSDDVYLGVLSLAKQAGCRFHFASDAHDLAMLDTTPGLQPFVDRLGLAESDIHPRFR